MKRFLVFCGALLLLAGLTYCYARWGEPALLLVGYQTMRSERVTHDMRIVVFSDVHLGCGVDTERLGRIVDKINTQRADAVLFLGDLFDNYGAYTEDADADAKELARIDAPIKLAVWGNHDVGGRAHKVYPEVMLAAGFQLLADEAVDLTNGVRIIGANNVTFYEPDISGLIQADRYNLLMVHEPDFATDVTGVQLQLSGHSHGGQVWFPLVGAPVLPGDAKIYSRGLYEKEDGGAVFVTRGIGMSIMHYRFLAPPEIVVIDLEAE